MITLAHVIYLLKACQGPLWASVTSAVDPFVCLSFIFSFSHFHYSILSYQEKKKKANSHNRQAKYFSARPYPLRCNVDDLSCLVFHSRLLVSARPTLTFLLCIVSLLFIV